MRQILECEYMGRDLAGSILSVAEEIGNILTSAKL